VITRQRYEQASTFDDYLAGVTKHAELWRGVYDRVRLTDAQVARVQALGGPWHLLVLSEDWCGDAVNVVPVVARLGDLAANVDVRVLGRDTNPDIMDAHLTGTSRSIPVVVFLDDGFTECGWWGPRPSELQAWVLGPGQELPNPDRYREVRRWYARDQGATIVEELIERFERCASA
jgi:hypothetical protein